MRIEALPRHHFFPLLVSPKGFLSISCTRIELKLSECLQGSFPPTAYCLAHDGQ